MIKIQHIEFCLPPWKENDFHIFTRNIASLSEMSTNAGLTSDKFKVACQKIQTIVLNGNSKRVPQIIQSAVDVRAATYLLSTDRRIAISDIISMTFLEALIKPRQHMSKLSLLQLIRAFFVFFDDLGNKEELRNLAEFIKVQLAHYEDTQNEHELALLARNSDLIFSLDGPTSVVRRAVVGNSSLPEQFKLLGLTGYGDSRYQKICQYQYYLKTLEEIPVGSDHEVLKEIVRKNVFQAPGSNGNMLGHEALQILIDRSSSQRVSEFWQSVILTIAGDPRVPRKSSRYQRWWALLGNERIQKVRGWLSRFDLNLFLRVLEDYGQAEGDESLQRMFPARKKFLEGLIEQGLVVTSRLFVGGIAREYLRRNFKKEELPEFAKVRDTYRSMIYLQVGHCHMIEGSHNCTLRIFPDFPEKTKIANYSFSDFTPYELGSGAESQYISEFGSYAPSPASIRHVSNRLAWQHNAISYFQTQGIRLDVEKLFSRSDYQQYKRIHGVGIWSG